MTNLPPDQLERLLARQKSYTLACVVVLVLYCFLWAPGVIANFLFLQEAERMEFLAGEPLPGAGFLRFLWGATWALGFLILFGVVALLCASRYGGTLN